MGSALESFVDELSPERDGEFFACCFDQLVDEGVLLRLPGGGYQAVGEVRWTERCREIAEASAVLEVRPWPDRLAELAAENDELRQLLQVAALMLDDGTWCVPDSMYDQWLRRLKKLSRPGELFEPRPMDGRRG